MVKRKKLPLITGISVLCLFAILFSLFWFVPELKYKVFGIPIKTDAFLPDPDRMTGYYAEAEVVISDEDQTRIYETVSSFMTTAVISIEQIQAGARWEDQKADSLCVEFRYNSPYQYEGSDDKFYILSGMTFDTIGISIFFDQVSLVVFLEGQRTEERRIALKFESEVALLEEVIASSVASGVPNPMGAVMAPSHMPMLETDVLLEKPDAMRIAGNGKSLRLSDAQRDQLYTAFLEMSSMQSHPYTGPYGVREIYTPEQVYEKMSSCVCLEFQYDQRRSSNGIVAQLRPQEPDGEWSELRHSFTFDSIVILIDEHDNIGIVIGKNGLYRAVTDFYRGFDFGSGYPAFRAEVLALVP